MYGAQAWSARHPIDHLRPAERLQAVLDRAPVLHQALGTGHLAIAARYKRNERMACDVIRAILEDRGYEVTVIESAFIFARKD